MPPALSPDSTVFLLDAGAILEAANVAPGRCATSAEVVAEVRAGGRAHRRLEMLLAGGMEVRQAGKAAQDRVVVEADRAGSRTRLSPADASILALALDTPVPRMLLTDDYTVLDLARRLDVATQTVRTAGITAPKDWLARCSGCGRAYEASRAGSDCGVCGREIRLKPKGSVRAPGRRAR